MHSRAASNAYLRGDHHVAQQLSSKANKEWLKAEQLNAKAAEEILRIRNSENDMWKLDLHGLHASEAVHALEIHLKRIETQLMKSKNSLSYDAITSLIEGKEGPSFAGNVDGLDGVKGGDETSLPVLPLPRPSQTLLQVITGTGNHSHGGASLPAAVRSFLLSKGYNFHEARPGVIALRPKFRLN
ncbi:hypothetical protein AMTR_s00099p00094710 [Amborella trichopoda]|uniref:Smr domain-containing protein n=1 Tax=Amborella trichopoda TaxID=13333 RepID=W1NWM8_AMBTC|nr:hypothetical protein AMTR_s00099p00094710 [Amborella trichopoda]